MKSIPSTSMETLSELEELCGMLDEQFGLSGNNEKLDGLSGHKFLENTSEDSSMYNNSIFLNGSWEEYKMDRKNPHIISLTFVLSRIITPMFCAFGILGNLINILGRFLIFTFFVHVIM